MSYSKRGDVIRFAVLLLVVGALLALASHAAPAAAATTTVSIGDNWFCDSSHTITTCVTNISAGDTVHWVWVGTSPHSTTSDMAGWDSGTQNNGFTFDHTFSTAGSFAYHCSIHPTMHGTIAVAAAAVGGIAELPNVPGASVANPALSSGHGGLIVGALAATALVVALAGGAVYARKRQVH